MASEMGCNDTIGIAGKHFAFSEYRQERVLLRPDDFDLLLSLNTTNRKLQRKWVDELYRRLDSGLWVFNGDSIVVSSDATLLNGQHRLHAFRRYGRPVECLICVGIDSSAWSTYDGGQRRTYSQELSRHGISNSKPVATLTRAIWSYGNNRFEGDQSVKVTIHELDTLRERLMGIGDACSLARGSDSMKKLGHQREVSFLLWSAMQVLSEGQFQRLVGVLKGEIPADKTNPIFVLKERLIDNKSRKVKLNGTELLALCIKALNFFKQGKSPKFLKWQSGAGERFPELDGMPPSAVMEL